MNKAAKVVAIVYGVIIGLAGMEHGFFEILHGNVATGGIMIDAIGPAQRVWEGASEAAMTLVPNFLVTGILALVVGLIVILWSVFFVDHKYGGPVLLLLSVLLLLVGGGIAPFVLAIVAALVATRINKPLNGWRNYIPEAARRVLAALWPWALIGFLFFFCLTLEIAIFGWFPGVTDVDALIDLNWKLAYVMLGLVVLAALSGLAHDSLKTLRSPNREPIYGI